MFCALIIMCVLCVCLDLSCCSTILRFSTSQQLPSYVCMWLLILMKCEIFFEWCWIFGDCLVWNLFLKGTLTPWWSVKMIGIIVQDADLITTLTVVIGTQEHQYRSFTIMKLSWHSTRVWWAPRKFVCKVTSTGNLFTFTKDHEVITNMRSYHTNTYSAIGIIRTVMTSDPNIDILLTL